MGNSISIIVGQRLGAGEIEYAKDCDLKMVVVVVGCSSFIPQIYNTSRSEEHTSELQSP